MLNNKIIDLKEFKIIKAEKEELAVNNSKLARFGLTVDDIPEEHREALLVESDIEEMDTIGWGELVLTKEQWEYSQELRRRREEDEKAPPMFAEGELEWFMRELITGNLLETGKYTKEDLIDKTQDELNDLWEEELKHLPKIEFEDPPWIKEFYKKRNK